MKRMYINLRKYIMKERNVYELKYFCLSLMLKLIEWNEEILLQLILAYWQELRQEALHTWSEK